MKRLFTAALFILAAGAAGCDRTNVFYPPTSPSPQSPSNPGNPSPSPVVSARIEFRVQGNATGATVRHSDSLNGLTQVTTTLPYFTILNTTQTSVFVSLEATPIAYPFSVTSPFMAVQIFVNGLLFREATSSSFLLSALAVSGTWRSVQ